MHKILSGLTLALTVSCLPVFAQASGFGKDIPLEMAVRQIVPSGVEVVIDDGVDTGKEVSWPEESSWKKSITTAAQSGGYLIEVTDDKVHVRSKDGPAVPAPIETAEPAAKPEQVASATSTTSSQLAAPTRTASARSTNPTPKRETRAAAPAPRPAARQAARPAPRQEAPRREARVSAPTISGSGFVLIPEDAPAPRVAALPDAKGNATGWQRYEERPRQAAPAPVPVAPKWTALQGDDLYALLSQWSEKEGWRLVWQTDYRYNLNSAASFDGDYVSAVTQLLASMRDVRPMVTAEFYQGNKTLVVANNSLGVVN